MKELWTSMSETWVVERYSGRKIKTGLKIDIRSSKSGFMKSLSLITLLLTFALTFSFQPASAAIAKSKPALEETTTTPAAGKILKKTEKQESRLARLKAKLEKKFEKLRKKLLNGTASDYLIISLGLLLAAILFFALNGSTGVFNVFGSVAAIAAVVFFVLWLLELKK